MEGLHCINKFFFIFILALEVSQTIENSNMEKFTLVLKTSRTQINDEPMVFNKVTESNDQKKTRATLDDKENNDVTTCCCFTVKKKVKNNAKLEEPLISNS